MNEALEEFGTLTEFNEFRASSKIEIDALLSDLQKGVDAGSVEVESFELVKESFDLADQLMDKYAKELESP